MAKKTLYLTYDDGPNGGTAAVLDKLKAQHAPATFFLTGSNGFADTKEKELVERMIKEGHQLGNHCFVHKPATKPEYEETYGDMTKPAQKAAFKKNLTDNVTHFSKVLSKPDFAFKMVRLPGNGSFHKPSVKEVENLGFKYVGWDVEFAPNGTMPHIDKKDWQGLTGVACTTAGLPADKAIVLAHDHHWVGKIDLFAAVLKKLADNEYHFAAV